LPGKDVGRLPKQNRQIRKVTHCPAINEHPF